MENKKLKELGKKITIHRVKKDLTQTDLSVKSGLAYSTISLIENGKSVPRLSSLYKIANILEIDPDELTQYLD